MIIGSACSKSSKPAAAPATTPPPAEVSAPAVLPEAPAPPILLRDVGFESPESALHDPAADWYLVSNVNGDPAAQDGNGFISRVAPDGTLMELKWIAGGNADVSLDAPKGMALVNDTLFVADLNVVRSFDRKSGQPLGKVAIVSASFLNDVAAAPDGTLYVSDTGLAKVKGAAELQKNGADAIYTLDARGVVGVLAKGPALGQPNGLLADADGVWVGSSTGQLQRVDKQGQPRVVATLPEGLDGLAMTTSGKLVASSWQAAAVFTAAPPKADSAVPVEFEAAISDLESPADLGYDSKRRQLIVPLFKQNAVYIQQLDN